MVSERLRRGFALPAVLAVTGVVTIVFLVAITALTSLQAEAASARSRVRFLQRAMTAEATLSYMASTEPFRTTGLLTGAPRNVDDLHGPSLAAAVSSGLPTAEVWLDGRPYLMDVNGPMVVSMQDTAGLINLARSPEPVHRRLAARVGLPPALTGAAYPRFLDYVDPDDMRNLNGAEKRDYGGTGPADRNLLRPSEWLSLMGIRDAIDRGRWSEIRASLVTEPTFSNFNVNTAPAAALEVLFDISPAQARSAILRREVTPFQSLEEFLQTAGSTQIEDPERLYIFPSGRIVYDIRDGRSAWTWRGMLALTPGGLIQPVWISQTELMEAPRRAAADTTNATRFPYAPR